VSFLSAVNRGLCEGGKIVDPHWLLLGCTSRGFNASLVDGEGRHALHYLLELFRVRSEISWSYRLLAKMLVKGADVNLADPREGAHGRTPMLTLASQITDDFSAMDTLLAAGADPSSYDTRQNSMQS
jgi:hypothetical protein